MTIKQLEIFVAVAKEENITRAASALFIAQPAVSHSLSQLEQELGVSLFIRAHQRLSLSEEGKRLLPEAQAILGGLDTLRNEASSLSEKPLIRLGASLTFGEKMLPETLADYPFRAQARFLNMVAPSPEILSSLEKGAVDFAFLESSILPAGFQGWEVFSDRLVLVSRPDLGFPDRLALKDVGTMPWLLRDTGSGIRQTFDSILSANGLEAKAVCESTSNSALLAFAEKGLGLAVLPLSLAQEDLAQGSLKESTLVSLTFPRHVYLAYLEERLVSKEQRRFLDYLRNHFPPKRKTL
jgi:DNA-binding transcriptional LysR family regulator